MSGLAYKKRQTRTAFEQKLVEDFDADKLSKCPYEERGEEGKKTKMTLYYQNGFHVATWCKGEGWIFDSAYDTKLTG